MSILVINPNSSQSVTNGLKQVLKAPAGISLSFMTGPAHAPDSINDTTTAVQSAAACYNQVLKDNLLEKHDGFLICCFSDHPLIHMIKERTTRPVLGIMQAAISQALLVSKRFAIISTGSGYKPERLAEVHSFLGSASSFRFAGLQTSGLGVVELKEGDQTRVERLMKSTAVRLAEEGADGLILGCAGMTGMEPWVIEAIEQAGLSRVKVIDGGKAGVQFLAALIHLN